jgi:Xaa-Pro aminopeptidase
MEFSFSQEKLDKLMDRAGADLLLVTSKENIQYLIGGYRFFFFSQKDAFGVSRYLPCLGYPKGQPQKAFYVGNPMERYQQEVEPNFWVKNVNNNSWNSATTGKETVGFIRKIGLAKGTVAVEKPFMPADCFAVLQEELPDVRFVEAHRVLEALRAVKRPDELLLLREASELIIDSMLTVTQGTEAGTTSREIAEHMMREEVSRDLNFEYCLTCVGPSYNRAPSNARWKKGHALSLDSGGNKNGYIGDLARVAVMGKPTQLMKDLLAEVQAIQGAARSAVKAGASGNEIFAKAMAEQARCSHKDQVVFNAHGMGLVQHEAPHLTSTGLVPDSELYLNRPIEAGMVLSIETDLLNPEVGFIKLEDTVAVTSDGCQAYGDRGRDWIVVDC